MVIDPTTRTKATAGLVTGHAGTASPEDVGHAQRTTYRRELADMMTLTDHEVTEYQRAAHAFYRTRHNAEGHLLSAVAAKRTVPLDQYDRAAEVYRAWLVFNQCDRARFGDPCTICDEAK